MPQILIMALLLIYQTLNEITFRNIRYLLALPKLCMFQVFDFQSINQM